MMGLYHQAKGEVSTVRVIHTLGNNHGFIDIKHSVTSTANLKESFMYLFGGKRVGSYPPRIKKKNYLFFGVGGWGGGRVRMGWGGG